MSASGTIGTLKVIMGSDTAALTKGLKDSQSALQSWASGMAKIAGGIGLERVLEGFVSSAVNSIKHGVMLGDELNKMSQKAGVTVEEFGRLKYASELSDVSAESLVKSLGKLSKALVDAGTDASGKAARSFAAMGVEVKNADGTIRNQSEVLGDIAEKFKGYRDGAEKTALAIAIFGKAGADMIPLLNQGREGIRAAGDEAQRFGLVLDKQTTIAAEAFMDNLRKLAAVKQGLYVTIAARLLPTLVQLSEQFLEAKKNSDFTATAADFVTNAIRVMGSQMALAVVEFKNARREFAALADFLSNVGDIDDMKASWNRWNLVLEENQDNLAAVKKEIAGIADTFNADSFVSKWHYATAAIAGATAETKRLQEEQKKTAAPKVPDNTEAKKQLDSYIASQQKSIAAHQAEFDTIGMAAGAKERLKTVMQGLAVATNAQIPLNDAYRVKLTETANAVELLALKLGSVALLGSSNPFEAIGVQIDALKVKMDSGNLSTQDFAIFQEQAAKLTQKLWADSATSLAGSFESIGSSLSQMNDSWKKAAKVGQAIGAAVAFVNAYVAASQAFATTPFPGNIAIAAGVLAKGVAMVAAIKGIGFAEGGLVQGPGSGQSDSIPARLSNGEFVMRAAAVRNIGLPLLNSLNSGFRVPSMPSFAMPDKSSSAMPGMSSSRGELPSFDGGGSRSPRTINVAGLGRDNYSRGEVAQIIDGINDAIGDGYKLRIT